jgi:hypothetical protein
MAARKGGGPEAAATDLEAQKNVAGNARSSKPQPQNPQAALTDGSSATDTVREEAAARIQELLGVTDDDPDTWRRVNIRNAAENGRHCAECNNEFAPGEPVWRFRKMVGRFFGFCYSFAPHCERCASGDYHHFEKPRPCAGCNRPVHSTTPRWQSASVICCEDCGHKARAIRNRAARAERRGTRDCECCRKMFTPSRSDSRFCSVACKQRAYRQRVTDSKPRSRRLHKTRNGRAERVGAAP